MSVSKPLIVKYDLISQKTIRDYIEDKGLQIQADFDRLATTCYKTSEKETYLTHSKTFSVAADVETVWHTYLNIPPRDTWKCNIVSFGCMYCKKSKALSYVDDTYHGLREGQVLFLNISLFWGKVNIAVAHQITRINEVEKYIEFSYIEGGKTEGSQRLTFRESAANQTEVTHVTTYRGTTKSYLREQLLYPFLHGKVIAAFHRNVKQKIASVLAGK